MKTTAEEQIHAIALSLVPGIGHIGAKRLLVGMGSATEVFRRRREIPDLLPEVTPRVVELLDSPQALARAEQEYEFVCKKHIACLPYHDDEYPSRLRECDDAPAVLFFKGAANLNRLRVLSIVGTRRPTAHGIEACISFLRDLQKLCPDVLVVSGLAYGIDICAHREAMAQGLPTVGVLAHGLDRIYPSAHRKTAVDMLDKGGLLTEYLCGTTPDRHNFVGRNRIVAGMCDATIVIESPEKGGSLITAELANTYARDCFAFPGRATDEQSLGCNKLIRDQKASLILSARDFLTAMCWDTSLQHTEPQTVQRSLFLELSDEERRVTDILEHRGDLQINTLLVEADMPVQKMSALLFGLEMKGVVRALAGGVYRLLK